MSFTASIYFPGKNRMKEELKHMRNYRRMSEEMEGWNCIVLMGEWRTMISARVCGQDLPM